uniref:Peptidase S1 domain-containing protein n=1 Tax=Pelusios castaneus TaxID=367368 RepID=A0A8C8S6N0_9SAUR
MGPLCSSLCMLLLVLPLLEGAQENPAPAVFSRIIEGQDAKKNEFPWQVSVEKNKVPICGGSLISAQWVVSAAHCFNPSVPISLYSVVLGAHQLLSPSAPHPSKVQQIIRHPSYNATKHVADIALVKLKNSVQFNTSIRPISLPGASRRFPVESKCWVTGWGRVEVNKRLKPPKTLQKLEVPILNTPDCNNHFKKLFPNSSLCPEAIKSDMICAGYMNSPKGFCKGDSGGPLACKQDNTWYLAGVVSWFIKKVSEFPGVFTRVTAYERWIHTCMKAESGCM